MEWIHGLTEVDKTVVELHWIIVPHCPLIFGQSVQMDLHSKTSAILMVGSVS